MKVKDLKKDQVFFEKDMGTYTQYLALEDAHQGDGSRSDMWYCKARSIYGEVPFAQSDSYPSFPRLSQYDY